MPCPPRPPSLFPSPSLLRQRAWGRESFSALLSHRPLSPSPEAAAAAAEAEARQQSPRRRSGGRR